MDVQKMLVEDSAHDPALHVDTRGHGRAAAEAAHAARSVAGVLNLAVEVGVAVALNHLIRNRAEVTPAAAQRSEVAAGQAVKRERAEARVKIGNVAGKVEARASQKVVANHLSALVNPGAEVNLVVSQQIKKARANRGAKPLPRVRAVVAVRALIKRMAALVLDLLTNHIRFRWHMVVFLT